MKQQRDTLKRYQQRVEKLLESERELAKRLLSENKREYVRNYLLLIFNLSKYNIEATQKKNQLRIKMHVLKKYLFN